MSDLMSVLPSVLPSACPSRTSVPRVDRDMPILPTSRPSFRQSVHPRARPTVRPSARPTDRPTVSPSERPSVHQSVCPSVTHICPTVRLSDRRPFVRPCDRSPVRATDAAQIWSPARPPSNYPTIQPTIRPTIQPSIRSILSHVRLYKYPTVRDKERTAQKNNQPMGLSFFSLYHACQLFSFLLSFSQVFMSMFLIFSYQGFLKKYLILSYHRKIFLRTL